MTDLIILTLCDISLSLSLIKVLIRRRPLLYVVGLLIPSIFLMLVDVISFYLPLNSGTRIVFKISILLGYTVFRVNLTDEMPSTADRTPLIGILFFLYLLIHTPADNLIYAEGFLQCSNLLYVWCGKYYNDQSKTTIIQSHHRFQCRSNN